MPYAARTNILSNNPQPNCVIAILQEREIKGYEEYYVDIDFNLAVERWLLKELPVDLFFTEYSNKEVTYSARRIHYIREV